MWVGEISVFFKSNISEICLKMKINPPPGNIFRKTFLNWNFSLLISWLEKISIVGSHIFLRHVISTTTWRKKKKKWVFKFIHELKKCLNHFLSTRGFHRSVKKFITLSSSANKFIWVLCCCHHFVLRKNGFLHGPKFSSNSQVLLRTPWNSEKQKNIQKHIFFSEEIQINRFFMDIWMLLTHLIFVAIFVL